MNGAAQPVDQLTKILVFSKDNPMFLEGGVQHVRIGSPRQRLHHVTHVVTIRTKSVYQIGSTAFIGQESHGTSLLARTISSCPM